MADQFHNLDVSEKFDEFHQTDGETSLGLDENQTISLSTFDQLEDQAGVTGDRWTARVSYEMASWSNDAESDDATTGRTTMGGLLETSISLQEGNMEFQVNKGMVDATAAKASSTSGELGNAAKGR